MRRALVVVLDSLGVGALPDARVYGDAGSHTLRRVLDTGVFLPTLMDMGLGGLAGLGAPRPMALCARMRERSAGKDTTTGHWELAGLVTDRPFPTYPMGFPDTLIRKFSERSGYPVLGNRPASGTQIIEELGELARRTASLIVYTSADSVFQIAAHEEAVPREALYAACRVARGLLTGRHAVARVIARPYAGVAGKFYRTDGRHDFSLEPPGTTMLDAVKQAGLPCVGVGKIGDIFAGRGLTQSIPTKGNREGEARLLEWARQGKEGLLFVNLVDFDMLYGHRRDAIGYAQALAAFDETLHKLLGLLNRQDLLVITADHGCDPGFRGTDHTREYAPVLVYRPDRSGAMLPVRKSFADVSATVLAHLKIPWFQGDAIA